MSLLQTLSLQLTQVVEPAPDGGSALADTAGSAITFGQTWKQLPLPPLANNGEELPTTGNVLPPDIAGRALDRLIRAPEDRGPSLIASTDSQDSWSNSSSAATAHAADSVELRQATVTTTPPVTISIDTRIELAAVMPSVATEPVASNLLLDDGDDATRLAPGSAESTTSRNSPTHRAGLVRGFSLTNGFAQVTEAPSDTTVMDLSRRIDAITGFSSDLDSLADDNAFLAPLSNTKRPMAPAFDTKQQPAATSAVPAPESTTTRLISASSVAQLAGGDASNSKVHRQLIANALPATSASNTNNTLLNGASAVDRARPTAPADANVWPHPTELESSSQPITRLDSLHRVAPTVLQSAAAARDSELSGNVAVDAKSPGLRVRDSVPDTTRGLLMAGIPRGQRGDTQPHDAPSYERMPEPMADNANRTLRVEPSVMDDFHAARRLTMVGDSQTLAGKRIPLSLTGASESAANASAETTARPLDSVSKPTPVVTLGEPEFLPVHSSAVPAAAPAWTRGLIRPANSLIGSKPAMLLEVQEGKPVADMKSTQLVAENPPVLGDRYALMAGGRQAVDQQPLLPQAQSQSSTTSDEVLSALESTTGRSETKTPDSSPLSDVRLAQPTAHATGTGLALRGMAAPEVAGARAGGDLPSLGSPLATTDPDFSDRVAERIVVAANGGRLGSARIQLTPQGLGSVQIDINYTDDGASVQLQAASNMARDALEAGLPRLREMLDNAGIRLADAGVNTGTNSSGRGDGDERASSAAATRDSLPEGPDSDTDSAATEATAPQRIPSSLVDTYV